MIGLVDALPAAVGAAAERDWASVRRILRDAGTDPPVEVLDLQAEAAWWLGRIGECITLRERAYEAFEARGDAIEAARTAMLLSDHHLFAGHRAVAGGWLSRARRLLADQPGCLQHGCLALREGEQLHGEGRLDGAAERFEEALSRARQLGNADLEADALQAKGRLLITMQHPADGLAHLDEAMLAAAQGRLGAFMTGKVYCSLMSACEELGDMARVVEWSEEASRWAAHHGVAVFPGLCRVHRAEVLCHRGAWQEAEAEAARACGELSDVHRSNAAAAYHALGEIRRRLGDVVGAETAFARAEELGGDAQPGLALLRLGQGRVAAAASSIDRAVSARAWNRFSRARLIPAQVQVLVAAGEIDAAAAAAGDLEETAALHASPGLRGDAALARGRVLLARGDHEGACASFHDAIDQYGIADAPYDRALARVLLARACQGTGDTAGFASSIESAISALAGLGARQDRAEALALRREAEDPDPGGRSGLTERECDVLRLVVSGLTNREIASRLRLSEKTVARHLSNIFTKAGVSSRAAAAAFAFDTGIVERSADRR